MTEDLDPTYHTEVAALRAEVAALRNEVAALREQRDAMSEELARRIRLDVWRERQPVDPRVPLQLATAYAQAQEEYERLVLHAPKPKLKSGVSGFMHISIEASNAIVTRQRLAFQIANAAASLVDLHPADPADPADPPAGTTPQKQSGLP